MKPGQLVIVDNYHLLPVVEIKSQPLPVCLLALARSLSLARRLPVCPLADEL